MIIAIAYCYCLLLLPIAIASRGGWGGRSPQNKPGRNQPGTKTAGDENSQGRNQPGTKPAGDEISRGRSQPGQNQPGTKPALYYTILYYTVQHISRGYIKLVSLLLSAAAVVVMGPVPMQFLSLDVRFLSLPHAISIPQAITIVEHVSTIVKHMCSSLAPLNSKGNKALLKAATLSMTSNSMT